MNASICCWIKSEFKSINSEMESYYAFLFLMAHSEWLKEWAKSQINAMFSFYLWASPQLFGLLKRYLSGWWYQIRITWIDSLETLFQDPKYFLEAYGNLSLKTMKQ